MQGVQGASMVVFSKALKPELSILSAKDPVAVEGTVTFVYLNVLNFESELTRSAPKTVFTELIVVFSKVVLMPVWGGKGGGKGGGCGVLQWFCFQKR